MTKTYTEAERMDAQALSKKLLNLPKPQRFIAVGVIEGMALAQVTKDKPSKYIGIETQSEQTGGEHHAKT